MADNSNRKIMIGILICLIIIALKPVSSFDSDFDRSDVYFDEDQNDTVIQLAENRIAIVDANTNSGDHGKVIVLEFEENKKTFELIGTYDYLEDFYEEY